MTENEISNKVIGAVIEVQRALGSGLPESAYKVAVVRESATRTLKLSRKRSG